MWILMLAVCLTFVFLGGCIAIKNSKISAAMTKEERDKFADEVACKVVEKLKKECPCPQKAGTTSAESNKPCKQSDKKA